MKYSVERHAARLKKKIKRLLTKGKASRTIILAFALLVLIPTALLLYYYYKHTALTTESEIIRAMQGTLLQTKTNVSYRMEAIDRISDMLFVDPTLNAALVTDPTVQTVFNQKEEHDAILRILKNFLDTEEVYHIKIYIKSPKLYSNERVNFFPYKEAEGLDWFNEMERADGAIYWSGVRTVSYSYGIEERVLTCGRLLKDLNQFNKVVGAVLIDVREQVILDILNDAGFPVGADIRVVDEAGAAMVGEGEGLPPGAILTDGIGKTENGYLLVSSLQQNGWKLASAVPWENFLVRGEWFNRFFGVLILMLLFVLFMLAFFVMYGYVVLRVDRRIRRIAMKIKSEGAVNYISDPVLTNDDFYDLESRIDVMICNIRDLMQRSYCADIEKKDAELKLLQAQINPHFLYNTLDSISWKAIRTGATDVNSMIQSLSQYFRLSLSDGRDMVRVRDEISLAKTYLDIQNSRFMNIISVTFDVVEDILEEMMPKLTLQPLLENAILHGLQYREDKDWKVIVAAWREEEYIVFRVTDNGVGMTAEQIDTLYSALRSEGERSGYGLYNIARRLELRYGDKNCLYIKSTRGEGTEVMLRIMIKNEI